VIILTIFHLLYCGVCSIISELTTFYQPNRTAKTSTSSSTCSGSGSGNGNGTDQGGASVGDKRPYDAVSSALGEGDKGESWAVGLIPSGTPRCVSALIDR
jgi:hypothetical protein